MPTSFRLRLAAALLLLALPATPRDSLANGTELDWATEVRRETVPPGKPLVTGSTGSKASKPHALDGIASYYWQDQMTASGEQFDKRAMTAAHPTLPFGTFVEVTNLGNGRKTVVRINDRGPFKPGRVIDVSEAAADKLGMRQRGLAPVRIEIVTAATAR